jgi:hypothetical protein
MNLDQILMGQLQSGPSGPAAPTMDPATDPALAAAGAAQLPSSAPGLDQLLRSLQERTKSAQMKNRVRYGQNAPQDPRAALASLMGGWRDALTPRGF